MKLVQNMNNGEIITKAKTFCEEQAINKYPVDIVNICNKMGIKVFEDYLGDDVSGFIVSQKEPFGKYGHDKVIVVNLYDSPRRRRFTIAHELAHYALHRSETNDVYAHRDADKIMSEAEKQANLFASIILMPESLVAKVLEDLKATVWDEVPLYLKCKRIAEAFGVSETVAQVRLAQLSL